MHRSSTTFPQRLGSPPGAARDKPVPGTKYTPKLIPSTQFSAIWIRRDHAPTDPPVQHRGSGELRANDRLLSRGDHRMGPTSVGGHRAVLCRRRPATVDAATVFRRALSRPEVNGLLQGDCLFEVPFSIVPGCGSRPVPGDQRGWDGRVSVRRRGGRYSPIPSDACQLPTIYRGPTSNSV